jgi:hypothetical protein
VLEKKTGERASLGILKNLLPINARDKIAPKKKKKTHAYFVSVVKEQIIEATTWQIFGDEGKAPCVVHIKNEP